MADLVTAGMRSLAIRSGIDRVSIDPNLRLRTPFPPPTPAPPPPSPAPPPQPAIPAAPLTNPFTSLPLRSPGDRIKSDDFNALAKGLQLVGDAYVLAGALFGVPFGQARVQLAAQQ